MPPPAASERCTRCLQFVPVTARRCPQCGEFIRTNPRRLTLYFAVAGIVCILSMVILAFYLHPPSVDTENTPAGDSAPPPPTPAKKPPLD